MKIPESHDMDQDSASKKAEAFGNDWLSILGVQKGLTGLAKVSPKGCWQGVGVFRVFRSTEKADGPGLHPQLSGQREPPCSMS